MRIFKFGGASVKNAEAVKNVAKIIQDLGSEKLLVVISAMGKTTNLLEDILHHWYYGKPALDEKYNELKSFHLNIVKELISDEHNPIYNDIENLLLELECLLEKTPDSNTDYDLYYDQIVCYGEFLSTKIVSNYLLSCRVKNKWVDARNFIITSSSHRNAKVLWDVTEKVIQSKLRPFLEKNLVITQGFIGKGHNNSTTTLGREGSDYSAAIFAYCTEAEDVTIWKDVDGVMNADPKKVKEAKLISQLSYQQAIELAYYGASVIHPKTIQPLQAKGIVLKVKSFMDPTLPGTSVNNESDNEEVSSIIIKEQQCLLHLSTRDYSFIIEEHLSAIFDALARQKIKVNLMQNTAISFDLCLDCPGRPEVLENLIAELAPTFETSLKQNLKLYTLYGENADLKSIQGQVVLEQIHGKIRHLVCK